MPNLSQVDPLPFHMRNILNAEYNSDNPSIADMSDTLNWKNLCSFCWIWCICVALALFQAARSSGCRPASYAGNTTEYTVCFSLSNPWNVLTTQGSHWFSHTVALFTLALSGSHARPAIFTRYTFASLSVMQSFWGPRQQRNYQELWRGSAATPQTDE